MNYFKGIVTKDFVSIFFSVLFFIAPGIAVIRVFFPSYFESFDSLKLVLFSASLLTPLVALFWVIVNAAKNEKDKGDDREAFLRLFSAVLSTALSVYISFPLAKVITKFFNVQDGFNAYLVALATLSIICGFVG